MKTLRLSRHLLRGLNSWNYLYLMVALLVLMIADPIFENAPGSRLMFTVINSVILVAGVWGVHHSRTEFWIIISLAIPAMTMSWMIQLGIIEVSPLFASGIWLLFILCLAIAILRNILSTDVVGANVIFGALSVYILIGVLFALLYGSLELFSPGSFSGILVERMANTNRTSGFVYYSFVTLTTLGYGDILPLHPIARVLSILEAMFGVTYMAVLLARFVSMYRDPSSSSDE